MYSRNMHFHRLAMQFLLRISPSERRSSLHLSAAYADCLLLTSLDEVVKSSALPGRHHAGKQTGKCPRGLQ